MPPPPRLGSSPRATGCDAEYAPLLGETPQMRERPWRVRLRVVGTAVAVVGIIVTVAICFGLLTWDHTYSIDRIRDNHLLEERELDAAGVRSVERFIRLEGEEAVKRLSDDLLFALQRLLYVDHVHYQAIADANLSRLAESLGLGFGAAVAAGDADLLGYQEYEAEGLMLIMQRDDPNSGDYYVDLDDNGIGSPRDRTVPKRAQRYRRDRSATDNNTLLPWRDDGGKTYPGMDILSQKWVLDALYEHKTTVSYVPFEGGPLLLVVTPVPTCGVEPMHERTGFKHRWSWELEVASDSYVRRNTFVYPATDKRGFLLSGVRMYDMLQGRAVREYERQFVVTGAAFGREGAWRSLSGPFEAENMEIIEGMHPLTGEPTQLHMPKMVNESSDFMTREVFRRIMAMGTPDRPTENGGVDPFEQYFVEYPSGTSVMEIANGTGSPPRRYVVNCQGLDGRYWIVGIFDFDTALEPHQADWDALRAKAKHSRDEEHSKRVRDRNLMTLPVVVITVVVAVLIALVVESVHWNLSELATHLGEVERMQLNDTAVAKPLSRYTEIRAMERTFRRMFTAMKEFREYIPDAVLRKITHGDDSEITDSDSTTSESESSASGSQRSGSSSQHRQTSHHLPGNVGESPTHLSFSAAKTETELLATPSGSAVHKLPLHVAMKTRFPEIFSSYSLARKRTVVSVSICCREMANYLRTTPDPEATTTLLTQWLQLCTGDSATFGGIVEWFHGDMVEVSFNALIPCRNAAGQAANYALHIRSVVPRRNGQFVPLSADALVSARSAQNLSVHTLGNGSSLSVELPPPIASRTSLNTSSTALTNDDLKNTCASGTATLTGGTTLTLSNLDSLEPCIGIASSPAFVGSVGCPGHKSAVVLGRAKRLSQGLMSLSREMGLDILLNEKHADALQGFFTVTPVDIVLFPGMTKATRVQHLETALDTTKGQEWMYQLAKRDEQQKQYDHAWKQLLQFSSGRDADLQFAEVLKGFATTQNDAVAEAVHAHLKQYNDSVVALTGQGPSEYEKQMKTRSSWLGTEAVTNLGLGCGGRRLSSGFRLPSIQSHSSGSMRASVNLSSPIDVPSPTHGDRSDSEQSVGRGRRNPRRSGRSFPKKRAKPHDSNASPTGTPPAPVERGIVKNDSASSHNTSVSASGEKTEKAE